MTKNDLGIRIRRRIKLVCFGIPAYIQEFGRYIRYSNVNYYKTELQFIAIIVANYHVIEKGLTMTDFRLGFGQPKLLQLIEDLEQYGKLGFSPINVQYQHAIAVVDEYMRVHNDAAYKLNGNLISAANHLLEYSKVIPIEQTETTRTEYFKNANSDFEIFSTSRHSCRNFSKEDVPLDLIQKAVNLCNNTPTPCNRQPNRMYVVTDHSRIENILTLQGGTRGFGHLGNKLLIITSDMSVFSSIREHNEALKSGGMYAMNLLYALHYYRIGACALQWGMQPRKEKKLRNVMHIPKNEQIIMMILVGYPADKFKLANSCRTVAKISIR